jgi:DNA-directed RNA polymerase subunit RPC12/RpoP
MRRLRTHGRKPGTLPCARCQADVPVGDFIYVKVIPEAGNGEPRDVGLCPRCHHHIMFGARKPKP